MITLDDVVSTDVLFSSGSFLRRNLLEAVEFRAKQHAIFVELCAPLERHVTEQWQAMVDEWEADPKKPNPYHEPEISEATDFDDLYGH